MRMPASTGAAMRRPAQYSVQRRAGLKSWAAPTGGWISNRNLAIAGGPGLPPAAAVLENWFPTATGVKMRRGSQLYATLGDGSLDVTTLFSYKNGNQEQLFGATDNAIYDITTISSPFNYMLGTEADDTIITDLGDTIGEDSTADKDVVSGTNGGDWVVLQFGTTGGTFLIGVNGVDNSFRYDGTDWYSIGPDSIYKIDFTLQTSPFTVGATLTGGTSGASAEILKVSSDSATGYLWLGPVTGGPFQAGEIITDGSGGSATASDPEQLLTNGITGIPTSDFSYVWSYKERLFFVEKESLNAWYLLPDEISGAAQRFPLNGVFNRGGSLLWGASWSLDSGSGGSGLSEQCIFVTTEGEVAVYQGDNPSVAADWHLVGVYRIGRPLGKRAHIRAGGDLVVATDIGFVPLSQAIQRDYAALSPSAVSYNIEDEWNKAVAARFGTEWRCEVWPNEQMVIIALPTVNEHPPTWFVANARTGSWSAFTNWDATALEIFQGRCFFGSRNGRVVEANVTGTDEGEPYTAVTVPLFEDLGTPTALKSTGMARAVLRGSVAPVDKLSAQLEYKINLPPAPAAAPVPVDSVWGGAVWGESEWGAEESPTTYQNWRVTTGTGYSVSMALQITSGSIVPLDTKLVRLDLSYEVTEAIS